jgi:hypothetical protein
VTVATDRHAIRFGAQSHSVESWHFDTERRSRTRAEIKEQPKGAGHGLFCAVEATGGLLFLAGESDMQTWLYKPRTRIRTQLEPGGQLPESPIDHGSRIPAGMSGYAARFEYELIPPTEPLLTRCTVGSQTVRTCDVTERDSENATLLP